MTYEVPQLTLVGNASHVVLGQQSIQGDVLGDTFAALEAEW